MAQVTETVARGILAGHGYTDNEVRQLAHHWLASHEQAPAQAAPAAVAVPTFEDFCKRHGLDPKKMDGHGGMWARVALDECRAITTQPVPQQDVQEPVALFGELIASHEGLEEELRAIDVAGDLTLYTAPQADSQPAPDETTAMNRTRELAESGRWPSDWVEAYRRGYSDRAARATADSVTEPAGGANWQDISTAPKDGTRFVAVGNNYGLYSEAQHTCIAQWFRGCWMEVSEWNEDSELQYLTHWMPLPPLPGSAASATADSVTEDAARLEALHAAVTAIYLDDSSDFKSALGAVVRHLDPALAGDLLAWPKRAYDISLARLDAARKQGGA